MSPEFHGIHLLYLNSKIIALRAVTMMLFFLLVAATVFALSQWQQMEKVLYDIEEGNSVTCEEGYVSKIVEGSRVTCIMLRVAPGALTYTQAIRRKK